jgi:hypothetical protein
MEIKGGGNNGGTFRSSANLAAKGGHGGGHNNFNNRGSRGGFSHGGSGRGQHGGRGGSRPRGGGFQAGVFCQLCEKEGHIVIRYFKRFNPLSLVRLRSRPHLLPHRHME